MTLLTALGNLSWRRCLLDASYMPPNTLGKCQKFPATQKYCLRPREQGLSQSLQHDKPNVRGKFFVFKTGWLVSPVLMTQNGSAIYN